MDLKNIWKKLSGKGQASSEPRKPEVPRAPRIPKEPFHQLSFQFEGNPNTDFEISNISIGGLGLVARSSASTCSWPQPLIELPATLTIGTQCFRIQFKLVYTGPHTAGGAFVAAPREMLVALQKHLEAELAASAMSYIGPEMLNPEEDGSPHWYRSDNAELFIVINANRVVRFNAVCFGNYIEAEHGKTLRFGRQIDEHDYSKPSHKASTLTQWDSSLEPATLAMFVRMIKHIPKLKPELKEQVLSFLK